MGKTMFQAATLRTQRSVTEDGLVWLEDLQLPLAFQDEHVAV